jgi:hypothetical protein
MLLLQTGQTAARDQAPATAPQMAEVLPSYEGQNVVSVEPALARIILEGLI